MTTYQDLFNQADEIFTQDHYNEELPLDTLDLPEEEAGDDTDLTDEEFTALLVESGIELPTEEKETSLTEEQRTEFQSKWMQSKIENEGYSYSTMYHYINLAIEYGCTVVLNSWEKAQEQERLSYIASKYGSDSDYVKSETQAFNRLFAI